jgi:3-hydroxyacyl-CoA dehydrogenase
MLYGDMIGAGAVLATMERLGAKDERFAPSRTLRQLAAEGGRFTEVQPG